MKIVECNHLVLLHINDNIDEQYDFLFVGAHGRALKSCRRQVEDTYMLGHDHLQGAPGHLGAPADNNTRSHLAHTGSTANTLRRHLVFATQHASATCLRRYFTCCFISVPWSFVNSRVFILEMLPRIKIQHFILSYSYF